MKPAGWDGISLSQDRAFLYVCFDILPEARPGRHTLTVFLTDGEGETAAPVHSSIWRKCPPERMPVGDQLVQPAQHGVLPRPDPYRRFITGPEAFQALYR